MSSNGQDGKETVASRKLAAAELRKARKAARDPRFRLLSDSSDEVPKGILKNSSRIPTKRSVSECVDDLTQIMADLDVNIHDLPKATGKFCPHYHHFNEEEEDEEDEEDDDDEHEHDDSENRENIGNDNDKNLKNRCDCNNASGDSYTDNDKPKKSVRFDERVYEQVFFASKLYDRRFVKYHFSSRHHPQTNQPNKSKKGRKHSSKSESDDETTRSTTSLKSENSYGCKLSKSQRSKQSKKDKKKRLNSKKDDATDTSSDDQGYCSSIHSFSD